MTPPTRLGWVGVGSGLAAQVAAYLIAMTVGPETPSVAWLTIAGIAGTLAGTLVLGATRHGRLSRTAAVAATLLLLIPLVGFGAVLLMAPDRAADLVLGLPARAAVVLLGVGLLPVLIFPVAYAIDAADAPLDAEAMTALRAECERVMPRGDH